MSKVSFLASARTRTRARVARGAVGRAAVSARPAVYARTKHETKRIIVSLSIHLYFLSRHPSSPSSSSSSGVPRHPAKKETSRPRGGYTLQLFTHTPIHPPARPPSRDNPEKGRRAREPDADADADADPTPTPTPTIRPPPPAFVPAPRVPSSRERLSATRPVHPSTAREAPRRTLAEEADTDAPRSARRRRRRRRRVSESERKKIRRIRSRRPTRRVASRASRVASTYRSGANRALHRGSRSEAPTARATCPFRDGGGGYV